MAFFLWCIALVFSYFSPIAGQCNYDQSCWYASIGCTLAKGNPFERRSFITCDECLKLCLERKDGPAPYCCKAVVYDTQYKFCDLFAIQAQSTNDIIQYPGRVYLAPTGNCSTTTAAPTTAAPLVDCPTGQVPILSIFQNSSLASMSSGTQVSASTSEQCGLFCVQNKDDKGNPFQCKAASFSQGKCTLSSQDPGANTAQSLQPGADANALYLEKRCYPKDQAGPCSTIILDPHHILVGFNRKTVDASSYEQCLQQCLAAQQQFQFKCNSGQYYSDITKDNCVLNEETRDTKPDVYLATDDNNIYFEPKCDTGRRLIYSKKRARARMSMRDIPFNSNFENDLQRSWLESESCNMITDENDKVLTCVTGHKMNRKTGTREYCSLQNSDICEERMRLQG